MEEMEKLATDFWKKHRGKGQVTKVTPYSFTWVTLPNPKNPNEKQTETVYYKSYFLQLSV